MSGKKIVFFFICALCLVPCAYAVDSIDLDPIIVTPSRQAEPAMGASSNVTVISNQEIERSNAFSIAELVSRSAGVTIYSQGSPKNQVVDIRGSGDTAVRNVLVLVNGRKINPVDISGPDWLAIPMGTVDHIEVIRGAASVAYGDNANMGVVNIITKQGQEKPYAQVSTDFASYGSERYGVEAGGMKDALSWYLYSGHSDLSGYRVNSGAQTKDGQARVGFVANDQARFEVEGGWHDDSYRLPGGIRASNIAQNGRRFSDSANDYANTNDRFVRLSSELKPFESDGSRGTLFMDYSHRDRDTYGFLDYGGGFTSDTKRDTVSDILGLKYVVTPSVMERDWRLTAGFDGAHNESSIVSVADAKDLVIRKEDAGVYLLSDLALTEKLSVNGGARYQKVAYIFDQYDTPAYTTRDPRVKAFSGGLKYEYAKGSNIFASVADTFRFLATDEWYSQWTGLNTSLRHQKGREFQAGVVHQFGTALRWDATGFLIRNKDEIFVDPTLFGGVGDNSNYGQTERLGLEMGGRWDILKSRPVRALRVWDVAVSGVWQAPQFSGGAFDGKDVPFVPQRTLKVGTSMMSIRGLGIDLDGRYTGSRFSINDTQNAQPKVKAVVVWDSRVRFVRGGLELYAGINNLFNEQFNDYVAYGNSSGNTDYYPATGRSYLGGMKYRF